MGCQNGKLLLRGPLAQVHNFCPRARLHFIGDDLELALLQAEEKESILQFLQYSLEQGIVNRRFTLSELFPKGTLPNSSLV